MVIQKKDQDNREVFVMETNLNILSNKQRAVEAEILQLKGQIRVLADQLEKETQAVTTGDPALRDLDTKLRQIDAELLELRRQYETSVRQKQLEREKLEADGRMVRIDLTKKKSNKDMNQMKMKRLSRQLVEKEADFQKREVLIRDLKQKLHYI